MHAYGHQWACQLAYNPRLCRGLGLTDGEGVERTWSRLRKLVGVVRSSSVMSITYVPTSLLIVYLVITARASHMDYGSSIVPHS